MSPEQVPRAEAPPAQGQAKVGGEDSRESEMIGSLGQALAGVNLGPSSGQSNGFSFHSEHESGAPFNLQGQPNNNGADLGWGFNAERPASHFATTNNATEESNQPSEPTTPPPGRQQRKKSIELFLSQSPSQMLGNDVFKLSTNNLPNLEISQENRTPDPFRQPLGQGHSAISPAPSGFGDMRANPEPRRKTESPSSAVTGTTSSSRSGSPYNNADGSRTIHAYHGSGDGASKIGQSFGDDDRAGYAMNHGKTLNTLDGKQRMQSPYNAKTIAGQDASGYGGPYDQGNPQPSPKQGGAANSQQQQQQVLYMAVPTPDGRGQVLQPVQMVQLPGKPFAYVVPGQGGGMPAAESQQQMMMFPNAGMQQGQSNDPSGNVIGNGRNNQQNRGMGYMGTPDSSSQFVEATPPRMQGEDFNAMNQGGMNGGSPYNPNVNQQADSGSGLYSAPQRPPLDALLGQVRRLSRDQVGCRLVQQALDEEGSVAATLILNEGLQFWGEAMVDPFGNYLFQKILEKITAEERVMLVKSVSTRLVNASLNLHGTRSVQKIVELCSLDEEKGEPKDGAEEDSAANILTRALAPAAARLCIDSHGNHVIQRILLKLGQEHSKFVFDAVAESVGDVARHRHGCCVIQRCLDSPPGPARSNLVHRIVGKSLELMQDAYGNYVVQYVLDVCSDEDVHAVCESVVGKVNLLAIQKFSSNVMEKCLERCTDRVKEHYMNELSDPDRVRELMMDPFGNYVIQRALSVSTHAQAVRLVEAMRPHLIATQPGTPNGQRSGGVRNTAGGRRIMAKICRRFPNFTLNSTASREELYSQNKSHHRHQQQHSPAMGQQYAQMSPGPHPQVHQQPYNVNPHAINVPAQHQLDQRQAYYEMGDAGYFQHAPHMGNGAYPSF